MGSLITILKQRFNVSTIDEVNEALSNLLSQEYLKGYNSGRLRGYDRGLKDGYHSGYNEGWEEGYKDGYNNCVEITLSRFD